MNENLKIKNKENLKFGNFYWI